MGGQERHKGGHRQRLKDKFLERGIEAFRDDEVLELLLVLGTPRKDCKIQARELMARFGTLPGVLEASSEELQKVHGVGPRNVFAVHFLHAVARRYLANRLQNKNYLRSSREVADYLIHSMRDLPREVFTVIFLDAGNGILATKVMAEGTISSNTVYPREVISLALRHNAAALVIAHNHPSGRLTPSRQDHNLTKNLFLACGFMNISLLDHLIIGNDTTPYSFADQGLMEEIRKECSRLLNDQ